MPGGTLQVQYEPLLEHMWCLVEHSRYSMNHYWNMCNAWWNYPGTVMNHYWNTCEAWWNTPGTVWTITGTHVMSGGTLQVQYEPLLENTCEAWWNTPGTVWNHYWNTCDAWWNTPWYSMNLVVLLTKTEMSYHLINGREYRIVMLLLIIQHSKFY